MQCYQNTILMCIKCYKYIKYFVRSVFNVDFNSVKKVIKNLALKRSVIMQKLVFIRSLIALVIRKYYYNIAYEIKKS